MSSVPAILGLPPGVQFRPDSDELVDHYLLPRACGEPSPFHGVAVLDDDAAGSTLPEDLLYRHGRAGDLDAYFFVRCDGTTKPGNRQDRGCGGGAGTWKSQKRVGGGGGGKYWSKHNLNLHMGRGENGGSVGWVMHEYTLTDPSCPPIKICHISFSGHGRNSKRVHGGGEPAPAKRARVDVAAGGGSGSFGSGGSTTTTVGQDFYYSATAQGMAFSYPADAEQYHCCFDKHGVLAAVPEHFMAQNTAGMAGLEHQAGSSGSGSTTTVDQDYYSGVGCGSANHHGAPPASQQAALTGQEGLEECPQWLDELFSLPDMAFAAPANEGPCCSEEQVVSQAAAAPATEQQVPEHFMAMVQEPAGMAELYRGGEDQQEFLAPMGPTVDEFGDVSGAQASPTATPTVISWEGYDFV